MTEAQWDIETKLRSTRGESHGPFGLPGASITRTFGEYSTWHLDIYVLNLNLNLSLKIELALPYIFEGFFTKKP